MADDLYKLQRRDDMTNHGVRGLFLLNGGGAVALLALLQQIWSDAPELAQYVVYGLIPMALGVSAAAGIHFIRVESALSWNDTSGKGKMLAAFHRWLSRGSIFCFLVGISIVIIGALGSLPKAGECG